MSSGTDEFQHLSYKGKKRGRPMMEDNGPKKVIKKRKYARDYRYMVAISKQLFINYNSLSL